MTNYEEKRVELINTQINKLESAAKHETGTSLTLIKKI